MCYCNGKPTEWVGEHEGGEKDAAGIERNDDLANCHIFPLSHYLYLYMEVMDVYQTSNAW
jgi:hypothetical protein